MHSVLLPPRWRKLLLVVHIVATVSVLGVDLMLLALGMSSVGGAEPRTIYPIAHLAAAWLVAPLAVASLGTGLLLAILTPWGVFRYWWVVIKLAITAALTAAVLLVLVPRLGATASAVTEVTPHLVSNAERMILMIAPAVASSLLIVNVALAVFKPSWRLRRRARSQRELPNHRSQTIHRKGV